MEKIRINREEEKSPRKKNENYQRMGRKIIREEYESLEKKKNYRQDKLQCGDIDEPSNLS